MSSYEVVDAKTEETLGSYPTQTDAELAAEAHYKTSGMSWDVERGVMANSVSTLCVSDWDDGPQSYRLAEICEVRQP